MKMVTDGGKRKYKTGKGTKSAVYSTANEI